MTSLTFYGGVNEIGGNKILLEDKKTRVWLDFGMSFGKAGEFFSEFLVPKKCNGVGDYITLGLVPDLKGLYRQDFLTKMGRGKEEKAFDGIILSHAHFDHNGYFNLVRPDIPVYCSQASKCVMDMLDTTSNQGEFLREKVAFCFKPKKDGKGMKRVTCRDEEGSAYRAIHAVDKTFMVGDLKITPMPVDHSLPGAMAYAIETSEGNIIYSGDYRFHGLNEKKTRAFVEKAASFEPVAMISEGTRIDSDKTETEKDVYDEVNSFSKNSKSLVIANYPVRDTDRMTTFFNAAKDNGRRLIVSMRQAYLLKVFGESAQDAPKLEDVSIYIPRKTWGLITEEVDHNLALDDYEEWEQEFIGMPNALTCDDINQNQDKYIWRCDFFELKEFLDVKPDPSSKFIWSATEPFDVKMELNMEIVYNWLSHFGISRIIHKHVSGHANGADVKHTIDTIKPKKLFPVHTEHPELFKKHFAHMIPIEKGKTYQL
jgi:ribonuclease J